MSSTFWSNFRITSKFILPVFLLGLILITTACSLPVEDLQGGLDTAIAETVIARLTLTALGSTQVLPMGITSSPSPVMISVSVDTNCRSGPDKQYDGLGVLHVGEAAEVIGKNSVANYWVIINPDAPGTCWLWGMYATLVGDTDLVPEMTPPPTPSSPPTTATLTPPPTADFMFSFYQACSDDWVVFQVSNTGNQPLESARMQIIDNTSHTNMYGPGTSDKPFRNTHDCGDWTLVESLSAGSTRYMQYKLVDAIPGHNYTASLELCSQNGNSGLCVSKPLHFTIP